MYIHEIKHSLITNICGINISEATMGGKGKKYDYPKYFLELNFLKADPCGLGARWLDPITALRPQPLLLHLEVLGHPAEPLPRSLSLSPIP